MTLDTRNPNKPHADAARANMAIRAALANLKGVDPRRVEFMDALARGQEGGPSAKEPVKIYAYQQETVAALCEIAASQQERIEELEANGKQTKAGK
jgi:hypothetical protein